MQNQQFLLEQLSKLLNHKKSKKFYASKLHISLQEVDYLLNIIRNKKVSVQAEPILYKFENNKVLEENIDYKTGNKTITIQSSNPLSPKELEELVKVDNINVFIERTWLKSHKSGIWTYSICTANRIKNFYSTQELSNKLKELLPQYIPEQLPLIKSKPSEKACFIYISDDHAGAILENSIFGNTYSDAEYIKRLLHIAEYIKCEGKVYEQVYIISLGDQLNGWNSQTTRGGHEVKSESNKKQFDIYIQARMIFYNEIFKSGISKNYTIFNLENSNHSGLGFSYMANKALELYINSRFPQVKTLSTDKAIEHVEYGVHVFAYTHGKEEKQQRIPFALNMTDKIDAFFYQYFDKHGFSTRDRQLHVCKGDLHQYNMNYGKSCRYVNVPSIMGSSDYSEINFGDTRAGALIEIVDKNTKNINSMPVWF